MGATGAASRTKASGGASSVPSQLELAGGLLRVIDGRGFMALGTRDGERINNRRLRLNIPYPAREPEQGRREGMDVTNQMGWWW